MGKYILMHKDIAVARFELDEEDINAKPRNVYLSDSNLEHLPIGARMNNMKFIEWWQDRTIYPKRGRGLRVR